MADLDFSKINCSDHEVAEIGRQLADKLEYGCTLIPDDSVYREGLLLAAEHVRSWCGVQQEEERNG